MNTGLQHLKCAPIQLNPNLAQILSVATDKEDETAATPDSTPPKHGSVAQNRIGVKGAKVFADMLMTNKTLQSVKCELCPNPKLAQILSVAADKIEIRSY